MSYGNYGFRNYDPQFGRFPQLDPLTDDYPYYTPYQYAGNEPIANVDLDGLEEWDALSGIAWASDKAVLMDNIVVKGVSKAAPVVAKTSTVTTRIFGGLKAMGGILEAGVGIAGGIATSWTGIGAVGGGLVAAHGLDVAASGLNQLIFGTETKSFTEQGINKGLQISGMSEDRANEWAGNIDGGISVVGSGLAGNGLLKGASVGGGATAAKAGTRFIADGAGNVLDTKAFQGLQEVSAVVKGGRGGTQLPLFGKSGTYANLGNGHKIMYGADGRAFFDVSTSRIKAIQWNQAPNGSWFPAKGSGTKFQGPVPQSALNALGF